MNVLIVENDMSFRNHLAHRLNAEGFNVLESDNTQDALKLACDHQVQTIILDLHGLKMSALDFLRDIQGRCPDAKVVLINRTGEVALSIAAMKLGAFDEVTAPVDVDMLTAKLKSTRVRARKS